MDNQAVQAPYSADWKSDLTPISQPGKWLDNNSHLPDRQTRMRNALRGLVEAGALGNGA